MTDLSDLHEQHVAVTGRFADWTAAELEILLKARGAWGVPGSPGKGVRALIAAEPGGPKVDKANALGIPIIGPESLRAALGPPLGGFLRRLNRKLGEQPGYVKKAVVAIGAPASEALLARVEAQVGFGLPEAARNLWGQLDGLSLLWTTPELQPCTDQPLPWSEACHDGGPLWTRIEALRAANAGRFDMGMACIPPLETIFFSPWRGRFFPDRVWGPKETVTLGRRKVAAAALFDHLYGFDLFSPFTWAGLWADQEERSLKVVYGTDHGADWSLAAAVPLEIYLEFLLIDLGRTRALTPSAKGGWPQGIARMAHLPWVEYAPYQRR